MNRESRLKSRKEKEVLKQKCAASDQTYRAQRVLMTSTKHRPSVTALESDRKRRLNRLKFAGVACLVFCVTYTITSLCLVVLS